MKKIYHYSEKDKTLIGSTVARPDPITGEPLVPRNATTVEPLENLLDHQANVFDEINQSWNLVPDYRGYRGFDELGNEKTIDKVNEVPDQSWSKVRPYIHEEEQEKKRQEIRTEFFKSLDKVNDENVNWAAGFDSAIKLDAARRLAIEAGMTSVIFYDYENEAHDLTLEQAKNITLLVSMDYQQKLSKKQALMKAINDAISKEQLEGVNW